jgi:hypothetical protein
MTRSKIERQVVDEPLHRIDAKRLAEIVLGQRLVSAKCSRAIRARVWSLVIGPLHDNVCGAAWSHINVVTVPRLPADTPQTRGTQEATDERGGLV